MSDKPTTVDFICAPLPPQRFTFPPDAKVAVEGVGEMLISEFFKRIMAIGPCEPEQPVTSGDPSHEETPVWAKKEEVRTEEIPWDRLAGPAV